eukprot:s1364_g11.t1
MDAKRGTLHIFPQGAQVRKRLKAPVSRYELRVFWRRLDEDSGQASIEEFGRLMYKIELSQWPDLCEEELERIVSVLNQAAHKWHRAGGNWFKVFNQVDADGSGNLSFDELVSCVRGKFPCLRISTKQVTDKELHGLWKALDCNGGIEVPVHRFMVFMRRWSGDTGLHKGGNRQRHVHGASKASLPPVAERSDVEVRAVANALERALSSYYIDRGYLSVASASETAWHGGAKSNDSSCSWTRFFREMDKDGVGRLSYNNFLRAVFSKLKPWLNPSVALPVGGNGRSVGADHCFYSFAGFMAMQADPLEWAEKFEAEPAKQMMQRQPRAHPLPGAEEKAEPCDLFGDSRWMPLPRPKVVSPTSMPSMYQQYAPQYVGYPGYPGYPAIGAGMWPMPEPEPDLDLSKASALKTLATAMGSRVTEDMLKDVPKATFAEASRLLLAVLGFMCEGACPPMLRANVVARGPHLPLWQGLTPHMLLRDFFDADELLSLYGEESMRQAFDAATPASQGHFVTMLSRVAFIEAARPGSGRCLRAAWQGIFQLFPEISLVRALFTHIRRRCWEDCRDRSRMLWQSRSRSRDRKKTKSEANEDSQRFFLKNTGDLDDWKIQNCNVLMDKRKKQYRGMGFITLKPEGYYRGKKNTKQMMIEWVLEESHVVNGVKIDVTQADEKPEEDEDRKREDRVEERRLARLDKEQRMLRNLGGVAPHLIDRGQERLVPSPWFKRWRYRLWEVLPKNSPCSWDNPSLHSICGGLWREAVEYTTRTADKTVKDPKKGNFDDCKIFVGGLNLNTSVDQLMSSFAAYGQITDAVIMTDKITGKPRGFGFIVFESPDGVAAVLRVNDKHHVNGKWVDVKRATSDGSVRGTFDSEQSKEDIRVLWDKLDPSSIGEITAKGMMLGLYQVQLESWPDLDQAELERLATLINASAVKRLRSGGNNWYKIFNLVDKAQSGRLSFGSLREVLRDMWYGLALSNEQVSDFELKGLWKALDEGKSSSVTVGSFMVFMRRYGVQSHSMSKQKLQSNHLSTMSEEEEWKQMLVEAPALDANRLMSIATELTLGIHTWLNKPGVERSASTQLWPKFIEAANETATTRQGRLKFADFKKTIGKIIRVPPSSNELLAFWREVDRDCTGEALAENFDNAVYRLQVDTWPELDEQGISKVIQILNVAAEKWHRAAGNWYKVFLACDEDGSGSMTYDEMLGVFRKGFPGLSIPPQKLPEQDLRGFWRTLDAHRSGRVEVYDFMIFMRKYGAQYSMHRSSRARKSEVVEDFGHPAERTDDELRQTAQVLDESLTAYWNRRGVHVRAQDKWQRFLDEADLNRDGLVTFQDLEQALIMRLKSGRKFIDDNAMFAFSGKVLAQFSADGAVVNGVSHDDLYALWCRIDADQSGRVSYIEWTNGMYRLRIDTWPLLTEVQQGEVVDKISEAASKWIGNNTNWYKVFKLVDVDCSGSIGYDEFFRIIRRPLPCLAISTKEISNDELKGLWKAMDADLSGSISCQEFMVFMRRLEVRRGFAQWRPQVLSGKGPKASTLARAKAPPAELSPIQFESLKENFRKLRDEDLKKSYDAQGWHWQGSISEWEWPHVIREVLGIPEEQLSDDGVFTAFATLDSENIGEVCVETLLSEERKDPP